MMSKRVGVLGTYHLTENWVKKHPNVEVSVGHLGYPNNPIRPLSVSISPSGKWRMTGHRWFSEDQVSWEEAVNQCVQLLEIGVPLSSIEIHGSMTYTTEQFHQAINEQMKSNSMLSSEEDNDK